jgi:hypothetical protein
MFPGERSRILVASAAARGQNKHSFMYRSRNGQLFEVVFTGSGPSSIKKNHGIAYGHKDEYDGSGSYFSFDKISKFVRNASPYAMGAAEMMAPELIPAIEGATEAANVYHQFTGRGGYSASDHMPIGEFIQRMSVYLRRGAPLYYINMHRMRYYVSLGLTRKEFFRQNYKYCKRIENEGDLVEACYDDDKFVFDPAHNQLCSEAYKHFGSELDDIYID